MTISELAKKAGVRTDTLRHYERVGLIEPEDRSGAGYRLYSDDSLRIVQFILRAKDMGFTLAEIGTLLTLKSSETATCRDMLERTETKITETKETLARLSAMQTALKKLAEACPGGDIPLDQCPILDHLESGECHGKKK